MTNGKTALFPVLILVLHLWQLSIAVGQLPSGYPASGRKKMIINQGWKFHKGDPQADYYLPGTDDSKWKTVHLPHTLELASLTLNNYPDDRYQDNFHREVGWYRKALPITSDADQRIYIVFEGAHQVTDLWINGKHAGQFAVSGYSPFHFDISSLVKRGELNQLTVLVDNRKREHIPPDPGPFDYVKFGGLYRDVYLVETDPVHISFNWESITSGVYLRTPSVDPVNRNATIDIRTEVKNERPVHKKVTLIHRVVDRNGLVVLKMRKTATIPPGGSHRFYQTGAIEDSANLWSVDHPYLYRVNSTVLTGGKVTDCLESPLGIRSFTLHPREGFLLNGERIELVGANRHQHYPYIGDAVPNALHAKDMKQFKKLGFNTVRTAHYPHDDALIEACDSLGILVFEEAPTWMGIGDSAWFSNLEKAARIMVRNHRNHPSVVIWGGGINHRGAVPQIHCAVKQEDPSRLTASQSSRFTGWHTSSVADIYAQMVYKKIDWEREEPMLAMEGRSGPEEVAKFKRDPLRTGLISWNAHAYYTFFHSEGDGDKVFDGMMTIFRQYKPGIRWYPTELKDEPMVIIRDPWKKGTDSVVVYTNCQEVQLSLNGNLIDSKTPSWNKYTEGLDHPPMIFYPQNYEPGSLTALGINNGKVVAGDTAITPGKPHKIDLAADTAGRHFTASGSDIVMVYARILDQHGTLLRDAENAVNLSISGVGEIVGDNAGIGANPMKPLYGSAPFLVRAGTVPGRITLTATSQGLKSDQIMLHTQPFVKDIILQEANPIYDPEKIRIDLGAEGQLVQFDWHPWVGKGERTGQKKLSAMGGITFNLKTASEKGIMKWLGEHNITGKNGFALGDGVYAFGKDGLTFAIHGLPEGHYRLITYHHAPRKNNSKSFPPKEKWTDDLNLLSLPYSRKITVSLKKKKQVINISHGKKLPAKGPGKANISFYHSGRKNITLKIKGSPDQAGIWFNAFELMKDFTVR